MKYQVTLYDKKNQYRPASTIIEHPQVDLSIKDDRKILIKLGTEKICRKKYWTKNDLLRYNLLVAKVREYVEEK